MTVNRIITMGLGTTRGVAGVAGLVTAGYGGFEHQVVELARRILKGGRSEESRRRDLDIYIGTKVLSVNGIEAPASIKGYAHVSFREDEQPKVKLIETSSKKLQERLLIRVQRVKRNNGRT